MQAAAVGFQPAFGGLPMAMAAVGKLTVSNLMPSVSEADISELFSGVGPLVSSTLHYDCFGKSLGTAEVTFGRLSDAMKAIEKYNGVTLDGVAMRIEYDGASAGGAIAMAGANVLARLGAAGPATAPIIPMKNYTQKRKANHEHSGGKSKDISATELDHEMDAYMAKRKKV
jgi:RNA recognition motif-containing protein